MSSGSYKAWAVAVAAFIEDLSARGYSPYTLRDYRADVLRLSTHVDVDPGRIERTHIQTFDAALANEGLAIGARRRRLSAVARFIEFMNTRTRAPQLGPRLIQAAMRSSPLDLLLVSLVYLGCLKLQEIATLEGRDIRMRKRIIVTREGHRVIPLHSRLHEIVLSLRYHVPLAAYRPIIPGINGFPVNARTLHGRFQRLVTRAGLEGVKPDSLRREVSLYLARAGTPPGLVKSFLGKDRGLPLAPRKGRMVDLTCLRERLEGLPT